MFNYFMVPKIDFVKFKSVFKVNGSCLDRLV
jgi:hypothetical protein